MAGRMTGYVMLTGTMEIGYCATEVFTGVAMFTGGRPER